MSRDSGKRRIKWFAKPRAEAKGSASSQAGGEAFPSLPQWPPLPGKSLANTPATMDGAPHTEQQSPPEWNTAAPGKPNRPRRSPRTLWQRFQSSPRRLRLGMVVGAGVIVLCLLIGVVALFSHAPFIASGAPTAGQATQTASVSGSPVATASATISPTITMTTSAADFTITFTCASGSLKGTGKVCAHTQANATLSLKVRYCDGSYAGGKGLTGVRADSSGNYTWRWKVHTGCAGAATATVSAKSAGQTVTQSTTFTITR